MMMDATNNHASFNTTHGLLTTPSIVKKPTTDDSLPTTPRATTPEADTFASSKPKIPAPTVTPDKTPLILSGLSFLTSLAGVGLITWATFFKEPAKATDSVETAVTAAVKPLQEEIAKLVQKPASGGASVDHTQALADLKALVEGLNNPKSADIADEVMSKIQGQLDVLQTSMNDLPNETLTTFKAELTVLHDKIGQIKTDDNTELTQQLADLQHQLSEATQKRDEFQQASITLRQKLEAEREKNKPVPPIESSKISETTSRTQETVLKLELMPNKPPTTLIFTEVQPTRLVVQDAINEATLTASSIATSLQPMHNVFANAKDFLPYQVNVLNPSKLNGNEATDAISYLQAVEKLKTADSLYLGDLHGAWQKLLQHLSMTEMIQMPEETAQKFVKIHKEVEDAYRIFGNTDLEKMNQLVHQFKEALNQVRIIDDGRGIHLVGDIVGDRGQNDILTLLLLDHCKDKIKSRVFSNHDLGAIEHYQLMVHNKGKGPHCNPAVSSFRAFELANSTVANPAVSLTQLRDLYDKHFKQLELIHYDEQTETLSLHQAFNPDKVPQLLEAYITDKKERNAVSNALKTGSKAEYKQAVETLNQRFKECVSQKWLKGNHTDIQNQLKGFYEDIWYKGNSRRDFANQALQQDRDFPFYNPKAVQQVTFGHSGADEPPVAQGNFNHGSLLFYLLDQGACKPHFPPNQQFSRLFVPSLANPQKPLPTVISYT